jgi:hypothetical protein
VASASLTHSSHGDFRRILPLASSRRRTIGARSSNACPATGAPSQRYSSTFQLSPTGATMSPRISAEPFMRPSRGGTRSSAGSSRATARPCFVMMASLRLR